jgi:hypothetical protein
MEALAQARMQDLQGPLSGGAAQHSPPGYANLASKEEIDFCYR